MKTRDKILFGIGIVILILLHWYLFRKTSEGFFDTPDDYTRLRLRLRSDLGAYCKISNFVRNQAKEMQDGLKKVSASLPSADAIKEGTKSPAAQKTQKLMKSGTKEGWYNLESELDADSIYTDVYQCKDQLASARQSCARPNLNMQFVPCSVYMSLPDWSNERSVVRSLTKIQDDLPERLIREVEWFRVVIMKIKEGLAAGANPAAGSNPVGVPPTLDQMNAYKEGFSGKCSPEAAEYLRQQEIAKEAASCRSSSGGAYVAPTPSSEIARVNRLLDDPIVKRMVSQCNGLLSEMLKLQSDLEKLKNGTLYDWQQDGPKKTYAKFEGGDRTASFLFSLQQNQ